MEISQLDNHLNQVTDDLIRKHYDIAKLMIDPLGCTIKGISQLTKKPDTTVQSVRDRFLKEGFIPIPVDKKRFIANIIKTRDREKIGAYLGDPNLIHRLDPKDNSIRRIPNIKIGNATPFCLRLTEAKQKQYDLATWVGFLEIVTNYLNREDFKEDMTLKQVKEKVSQDYKECVEEIKKTTVVNQKHNSSPTPQNASQEPSYAPE